MKDKDESHAMAQSGFLCALAPLRENYVVTEALQCTP
jgi:hypothetical protein